MAEPEPVEKADMTYGAEPAFPWPLALAWLIFTAWGIYYVATRLLPAFHEWQMK
jgi:hypothetical protein